MPDRKREEGATTMEQEFPPSHMLLQDWLLCLFAGLVVAAFVAHWRQIDERFAWRATWFGGWFLLVCGTLYFVQPDYARGPLPVAHSIAAFASVTVSFTGLLTAIGELLAGRKLTDSRKYVAGFALLLLGIFMLVPSRPNVRASVLRGVCHQHLKQVGVAFHTYHDRYDRFPATSAGEPPLTWRLAILPYLENSPTVTYDRQQPWAATANEPAARTRIESYSCPLMEAPRDRQGRYFTAFVAPTGSDTVLQPNESRSFAEINDGVSNTILLVEACGLEIVWTEPRDFDVDHQPIGVNLKGKGTTDSPGLLSSYHGKSANVVLADGSVRYVSRAIDPEVLKKLLTANGGEDIKQDW